jgi:hypothetical protein
MPSILGGYPPHSRASFGDEAFKGPGGAARAQKIEVGKGARACDPRAGSGVSFQFIRSTRRIRLFQTG